VLVELEQPRIHQQLVGVVGVVVGLVVVVVVEGTMVAVVLVQ
jgi:hypothetical protein